MGRFLNIAYAIEVLAGRLNGSSDQIENKKTGFDNISYTKKIGSRAVVSSPCQKYNIQRYMTSQGYTYAERKKIDKKISVKADPFTYVNEDIFGFMRAENEVITEEEYKLLAPEVQKLFTKDKKSYKINITKKRRSRFQMSPLIQVSHRKVSLEWNVCSTTGDYMPYVLEVYSGIFSGIANVNIEDISNFTTAAIDSEFRDYDPSEPNADKEIDRNEKLRRIEGALRGLQYLSIEGNQNNHLTDTKPKFVILSEFSWGNNAFQGIINDSGLNTEAFFEALEENEAFRLSPVWIGVKSNFQDEKFKGLKEKLKEQFIDHEFIKIGTVKEAFDSYLHYLKETI